MFEANDGGVYLSKTPLAATITWVPLNATLSTLEFYTLSIDPNNPTNAFGGTQDNGTERYTGNLAWSAAPVCGDGGYVAIDFTNSNNVYAGCSAALASGALVNKSSDGGASFGTAQTGINTADLFGFLPPLVMDSSNSQSLYVGTYRVYQTTDGALSWHVISGDLTKSSSVISTIAVAPTNSAVVYAGTADGNVQVTLNAGAGTSATWTPITGTLPNRYVTQVAVDPTSASLAYVGLSGFGSGHVFRTSDQGKTWIDISGNLPNAPVSSVVIDPDLANTIYVGMDVGVFETVDGGQTWQLAGSGLPNAFVSALAVHHTTRTLRAATFGRSVWDLALPSVATNTLVASPGNVAFGNQLVQTASAAQSITLTNNLRTSATVSSVSATGDFSQTNTCGSSIAAGATCTVNVLFTPTAAGSRTGSIVVITPGASQTIALSGVGTIAVSLNAAPTTVTVGTPTTLTWSSPYATSCSASGGSTGDGWSGSKVVSGSAPATETAAGSFTYTLTCIAGTQSVQAQAVVTDTIPTDTLTASATSVTVGQAVALTWTSQNATSCSASGGGTGDGWSGSRAVSGSTTVTETAAGNFTYILTCTAGTQSVQAQTSVADQAQAPPPKSGGGGGGALDLLELLTLAGFSILRGVSPFSRKRVSIVME
jgi:hypothetical protein